MYNLVNIFFYKMLKHDLGKKLKEAREQANMTQKEVAQKLGVAQPVYQRFEKGTFECTYEQLKALCDIFDVSADYLLGRERY